MLFLPIHIVGDSHFSNRLIGIFTLAKRHTQNLNARRISDMAAVAIAAFLIIFMRLNNNMRKLNKLFEIFNRRKILCFNNEGIIRIHRFINYYMDIAAKIVEFRLNILNLRRF